MMVSDPLGKSHCATCGMVQRTRFKFLGLTDFYEKNYALYYDRPGVEGFNQARYGQIAAWVSDAVSFEPERILEVGCGRGWTMREMTKRFPGAKLKGLEPAIENSAAGRAAGLDIVTARLDEYPVDGPGFDLIYSNHVIQHVVDPVLFLAQHAPLLSEAGVAVVTVQDAREQTNELLYSDQNFSFMPAHFAALARRAGLVLTDVVIAPSDVEGIRHSQMALLRRAGTCVAGESLPGVNSLDTLFVARRDYLLAWKALDAALAEATEGADRIFNFGAGMYSFLLACYCPKYWNSVTSCMVDGQSAEFFSKPVVDPASISFGLRDLIVLGTRPSAQRDIARRFEARGQKVIRWDDRIVA
jgi:SAM-dependent methyltransferase